MTRRQLIELRKECASHISRLGARFITNESITEEAQRCLVFLTMVHSSLVNELKSLTNDAEAASAIVQLDDALGKLSDLTSSHAGIAGPLLEIRGQIHSAMAYLEGE
jgi:hypothetical protein